MGGLLVDSIRGLENPFSYGGLSVFEIKSPSYTPHSKPLPFLQFVRVAKS